MGSREIRISMNYQIGKLYIIHYQFYLHGLSTKYPTTNLKQNSGFSQFFSIFSVNNIDVEHENHIIYIIALALQSNGMGSMGCITRTTLVYRRILQPFGGRRNRRNQDFGSLSTSMVRNRRITENNDVTADTPFRLSANSTAWALWSAPKSWVKKTTRSSPHNMPICKKLGVVIFRQVFRPEYTN